ncbi:hypothetical protein [Mycolicibacterium fortuitum]|uniref:hypothetical protein n=1 Tax=Mycolicibacterium fortuitum TaxID=1766 RepID=UPI0007EFBD22|nr:hypothetical protein [Mycolicibacterium fortuitum]OBK68046.1 hypothetical protein A5654_15345 [Mycolicibacterium fortuitum]
MAYPEDPDFSGIDALPDPASAPKLSTELEGLAGAIQATTTGVSGTTSGKTPEEVVAATSAAQQATRDAATNAATAEAAIKILKDAVAAWKKNAPKKKELDDAQKAVDDAKAALKTAQESADKATDADSKFEADKAVAAAENDLRSALLTLQTLQKKRKDADEAYETARKQAAEKMKTLKGSSDTNQEDSGYGAPGAASDMPGTSRTGTPGGSPTARTAKPGGAPTATPSTGKPADTPSTTTSSTSGSGIDPSTAALAAALTQQGQQNQNGQQQAATQPTAQMPTMPTVPQQQNQQVATDAKRKEAEENSANALAAAGLGGLVTGSVSPNVTSVSSTSPSPAASEHGTSFRPAGTPISGVGLGGAPAVNTQVPHTTGNSATNLTTTSDVAGRPQGTENKPFTQPAPGTSTSGAHGTGTQTPAGQQQQTTGARPMGGMPLMPGMMGAPAASAPASRQVDGERERGVASTSDPLGLMYERGDAVEGGTIAQNRDKPAA